MERELNLTTTRLLLLNHHMIRYNLDNKHTQITENIVYIEHVDQLCRDHRKAKASDVWREQFKECIYDST